MERYANAKRWRSLQGFRFFGGKSPAGISLLHRPCLKSKERVRKEGGQYKGGYMNVLLLTMIPSCFNIFLPNPVPELQLHPKRPLSHCWQSQRFGFFPPALPDGFHDHAGVPGPVASLLCLRHGAPLAVLPRCRRRRYESGERRLL